MDSDDPERRIADQVHNVAFSPPAGGKRGYNEAEVDAFLQVIEAAFRDPSRSQLTSMQVRSVAFSKPPIGRRGYDRDEVHVFLDYVAAQLQPGQFTATQAPITARKSWVRRLFG